MEVDRDSNSSTSHHQQAKTHISSTPFKRPHIDNSSTESTPHIDNSNRFPSKGNKVNKGKVLTPSFRSSPSTYRPVVITFLSPSDKSPYKLVKLLLDYWKTKTSIDLDKLNITCRFGYNKHLLVIPQDAYTFDALQIVPFPDKLDKIKIVVKKQSSTPAHHSIVVHDIPLDTDFDDVKSDLEQSLGKGTVKHVVRLVHNSGQQLSSIRVDFAASNFVTSMLEAGYVKMLHGRHTVKEYHLPSRVSICNKCHRHGHLAQECPNAAVCIRCGVDHEGQCQSEPKCVNCGGEHFPGQSMCPEVQKIRQERRSRQTYAQATAAQSLSTFQTLSATCPKPSSTSTLASELGQQIKVYFDEKIEEIKTMFLDKVKEMSERVKEIAERLDGLTRRVEENERDLKQEKHIRDYFVAFGHRVQEIRETEEGNDTQSASTSSTYQPQVLRYDVPTQSALTSSTYQPQVPRYGVPTCYQCGQLGHIRRECPKL